MSAVNLKLLEEVEKRLIKQVEMETMRLADGIVKDFDEYRYYVGGIKGLRDAIATIEAVIEEAREGNS
jgi:hypothetical protein